LKLIGNTQVVERRGGGRVEAESVLETIDGILESPFSQTQQAPAIPTVGTNGPSWLDGGEGTLSIVPTTRLKLQLGENFPDGGICGVGHQVGPQALLRFQQFTAFEVGNGQIVGGLDPVTVDL
jgi:hypothetical protein